MSTDAALHAGESASRASNLPQSIRDLVDLVGLPATMALVKAYGGICINKVPVHGARDTGAIRTRLIELMGEEAALKLIQVYSGERLPIARCEVALRDERDRRIIVAYDANTSAATLALQEQMTERNVRNILKRVPGAGHGLSEAGAANAGRQGDLFEAPQAPSDSAQELEQEPQQIGRGRPTGLERESNRLNSAASRVSCAETAGMTGSASTNLHRD